MSETPLSQPEPWSLVARGYETDTMPVFYQFCERALELMGFHGCDRAIDVACGTGTMSFVIRDRAARIDAIDFSEGMLDCFRQRIERDAIRNITPHFMDGQNLQFDDATFDCGFSMFGLMFFPDRSRGFDELYRVLKPGGKVAISSWAPADRSPLMQLLTGSIETAFAETGEKKPGIDMLADPDQFRSEMERAGFRNVDVGYHTGYWQVDDADQFFESMVRGSVPFALLQNSLDQKIWDEKQNAMREYLRAELPSLPARLGSTACIAVGEK